MIRIRDAVPDDSDSLVEFNAAMALETENMVLDPATLRAGVAALLAQPQRGFYLVAEDAGIVIGCLMITHEWSDWRNGDWWWLQSVYVRADYRRHGVFRTLYADVEQRARRTEGVIGLRLYVERDNARAQRTYAALGMQPTHYAIYHQTF
ncbi:MAG TPA: GNAT family N-acetyltransferase [Rudaea sp.]|jgi:GNAT superfamily N-acetyltransferase|uniref:GNAT family N-acetyltransferase n=1 Tax=Rudaea sp. TaxID=2136325 RepID=UPI002F91F7B4